MRTITIRLGLASLTAIALQTNAQSIDRRGTISGRVLDEDERPVVTGKVILSRRAEYVRNSEGHLTTKTPITTWTATVSRNGTYAISGLPAGEYSVCTVNTGPNHIENCGWDASPAIKLGAGQQIQGVNRVALEGTQVLVRVRDPKRRISAQTKGPSAGAPSNDLVVGIKVGAAYARLEQIGGDAPDQNSYRILIPKRRDAQLVIRSSIAAARLIDDTGALADGPDRTYSRQLNPAIASRVIIDLRME